MSQSRSSTVVSGGPAAGDGGQESSRSQRVSIPLIPCKTRALQCRAPQNKRQTLQPNFSLPVVKDQAKTAVVQIRKALYPNYRANRGQDHTEVSQLPPQGSASEWELERAALSLSHSGHTGL